MASCAPAEQCSALLRQVDGQAARFPNRALRPRIQSGSPLTALREPSPPLGGEGWDEGEPNVETMRFGTLSRKAAEKKPDEQCHQQDRHDPPKPALSRVAELRDAIRCRRTLPSRIRRSRADHPASRGAGRPRVRTNRFRDPNCTPGRRARCAALQRRTGGRFPEGLSNFLTNMVNSIGIGNRFGSSKQYFADFTITCDSGANKERYRFPEMVRRTTDSQRMTLPSPDRPNARALSGCQAGMRPWQ